MNSIPSNAFQELSSLISLNIVGNGYYDLNLHADVFSDVSQLKYLYLDSNAIDQLATKLLPPNLLTLSLRNNSLRFITGNMFKRLTALNFLDLSENQIEHVSEKAFDKLESLQSLQLQDNQIRTLTARHLNGTRKLIRLDLSNNDIEPTLDDETFDDLEFLEWFDY